jgi:hypothetical protein
MNGSRLRPYLGPVIALLVVLALGAGTVYAAIPNGGGTYYACLTKSSGVVRLVNYPKVKCATGERFIKWSQQGPTGPAGAQGVQGPEGYPGPKGDPGPAGVSGSSNWGDIVNKPAGFADGVDDVGKPGYVSATQPTTYTVGAIGNGLPGEAYVFADVPIGTDVELTIIPEPGKHLAMGAEYFWRGPDPGGYYPALAAGMIRHEIEVLNDDYMSPVTFKVRTRVYDSGIAPAAFKKALKKVEVGVVTKAPKKCH